MSTTQDDGKIVCHIDGARVHSVKAYLKQSNPDWTPDQLNAALEQYRRDYPQAPLLSERAKEILADKMRRDAAAKSEEQKVSAGFTRKPLFEVFGLPQKAALNSRGTPIECSVMTDLSDEDEAFVPDVDPDHVFDIEITKTVLIGLELNEPIYLWGYHGTGKTSAFEQTLARTRRPWIRVQHTINTEEAHILGQWVVRDGNTEFQLGPLPTAMIRGLAYCADEYDFAMPSVTSVYQPVLEGKALVIKDAPPELRIIRPHANFRFLATGNTNGVGDETGLYQGTQLQNAANYSRFGIVEEVGYMAPAVEAAVVAGKSRIGKNEAEKLVEFANEVRKQFKAGKIGATMGPRELIKSAKNGLVRGSNWRKGLEQGFLNRLSRTDKEALAQLAQRMFG